MRVTPLLRYNVFDQKNINRKEVTLMAIVSLLETLVKGILEAEEKFFNNPQDFYSLETAVKHAAETFSADFLSTVLSSMNHQIYDNAWRKNRYNAQRTDERTIITTVGDVTFDCTYFRNKEDNSYHYLLEELINLDKHERLTEAAEVAVLTEALKTSYEEATRVLPSKQKISKSTVYEKVHGIAEEIPDEVSEEKKVCEYLHIEADEDHVAEQHGRWQSSENNDSFITKLIYIYELKQDVPNIKSRKELVGTFYFSGVYYGSDGNEKFWNKVRKYIENNYETDNIKKIYISGDGASWIKSGEKYLDKALFCADKYHLMKYINKAAGQLLDEKDIAKEELWHILYSKSKDSKKKFDEYTSKIYASASNKKVVEELRSYVLGNWAAVRRTLRNKHVNGCSAESHVSHILSDRLSSRPMGWSQTGADRMSKLRCYEKNYGREKIINLVRYSREKKKQLRTGTEDIPVKALTLRQITAEHYDQSKSYIERIQATIPGLTVRKEAAIRTHLRLM